MKHFQKTILMLTTITAISACTSPGSGRREVGAELSNTGFGNATMNNVLIQTGQKSYAIDLSNRFAQEAPAMINFAFNSAALDASAQAALSQQAQWIKQFPEIQFRVYGHTDLVGGNAFNKRLGLKRARTVVNFLVSRGISRSRLEAVASFGETQPLVVTDGRERRNRRTVTEVSGFVQNHPMVLNGKYAQIIFRDYVESAIEASSASEAEGAGSLTE